MRKLLLIAVLLAEALAAAAIAQEPVREYISDRPCMIVSNQQNWGVLGFNLAARMPWMPPQPLRVKDKEFAKGLGTHAVSEISVLLEGKYATFEAQVGLQSQGGRAGSVVFQVLVDDVKKFDSGLMTESSDPKPVKVSVADASALTLVVTDGGNGVGDDLSNWLEPVLTRAPSAAAQSAQYPDMAPFARLITCDPQRMDGVRTGRLQEFDENDLQLDKDVLGSADGTFTVPVHADGRGAIGLRWLERRRITQLGIEFPDEASMPSTKGVQVQAWLMAALGASPGGSAWQGKWVPMKGEIEARHKSWLFSLDCVENELPPKGILKVRWVFPQSSKPIVVKRLIALTATPTAVADLVLQVDGSAAGQTGAIEMYNGTLVTPRGEVTSYTWDLGSPAHIQVKYSQSTVLKTDRTVLRLKLPAGRIGVAVDDCLANPCVYVPDFNLFAARDPAPIRLKDYKKSIDDKKTVLQQVRARPDQTFQQAMDVLHLPRPDTGPTLISLACDNRKFVVNRNGSVSFELTPKICNYVDHDLGRGYYCSVNPRFGDGSLDKLERHLQGEWIPIPVISVDQKGVVYRQRSYVAPYGQASPDRPVWWNNKPLFVAEITVTNTLDNPADSSVALDFLANSTQGKKMSVQATDYGVVAEEPDMALVAVNTSQAGPLKSTIDNAVLTLSGTLPAHATARCCVYIPGWQIDKADLGTLKADDALVAATEKYWKDVCAQAAQVEVPDRLLNNIIRASQVHCLLAARNVNFQQVAPFIASMNYGPLDSEAQSVIRGMAFLGHEEFARRGLDYFISRYNKAGYLEPTYTVMGTGWNLWNIGEFFGLYDDVAWMKRNAPEVARVCDWIMRQRAKTMKLDARGERLPEYGLNPPGAMADWEVFSYYFYSNGYFHVGLDRAAKALARIGFQGADKIASDAADYRKQIERAFHYVQGQAPVFALKNGAWVPESPTQLYCPAPTDYFYRGEDYGRSWCYDVELGSHHLVPQGVLDPRSKDVEWMMDYLEDVPFLAEGLFAYPKDRNEKDPFNYGGFGKVQPYYARNVEVYALRDDVKPFIRGYFNTVSTLLNREDLSLWEHLNASGAFNKTHETGYFLHQSRLMLVQERGKDLWLAPFVTNNWLKDGLEVSVAGAPTEFGKVSYRIESHVAKGYIEAAIEAPTRSTPRAIVIRLRHPEGKPIKAVTVNGEPHRDFDPKGECVRIAPGATKQFTVRAAY